MTAVVLTPELVAAWRARVVPVEGGHLRWTGRVRHGHSPLLLHRGRDLSAYRIAFVIGNGVEPTGTVAPGCAFQGCVAPEHQTDTASRQRRRAALRQAFVCAGPRRSMCRAGHVQDEHGRFDPQGRAYCLACKTTRKHRAAA